MLRRTALLLPAAVALGASVHADDAASLVLSSKGTLPLLLTVPHDGGEFIGLVPARTTGAMVRDAGTRDLAERVAVLLEQRLGKRPYLVIAKFSRKFLDANRVEQEAMESKDALPAYEAYHAQVAAAISEIRREFPGGSLLIDVHGQSGEPGTTFRGTRDGLTVKSLLKRHGPAALQGETSIIGVLASKGYTVHPSIGATSSREDKRYAGGHTVFTYGSHQPEGIDAIQLEFGKSHRDDPRLAENVAEALASFLTHYALLPK